MNEPIQPPAKPLRAAAIRSGTQDELVYAHMFDAILEQRLAPATRLSEEALGEIFAVSRTVIRRALSRLCHEGVVLLRPNRGAIVASPSVEQARQIFHARRLVERALVELAVPAVSAEQLARLRQLAAEESACFARGERNVGVRLAGEFHLRLGEAANNPPLAGFQRSLVAQSALVLAQYESGSRAHCPGEEREQLLDALQARDRVRALALMMSQMDRLDSALERDENGAPDDLHAVFSHLALPGSRSRKAR